MTARMTTLRTHLPTKALAMGFAAVLLAGCSGMNDTEQRVLSGTAIGAAAGAGLGAVTGGLSIPAGAAIGAAAGAVGGFGYDYLKRQAE
jgi:uncharacterized membrane protein